MRFLPCNLVLHLKKQNMNTKQWLAIALMALMTLPLAAQQEAKSKMSPQEKAEMRTERMTKHLELTPEQQVQVKALHEEMAAQEAEYRAQRKAQMQAMDARLKKILTEEQYAKHLKHRENMTQKLRKRRGRVMHQEQMPPE